MKSDSSEIEKLLKSVDAWLTGHFLLSSGLHSDQYIQCQRIMQFPRYGAVLADALAERVFQAGLRPQAVVGPALGAIHWELYVAQALDKKLNAEPVRGIFAERPEGVFEIRRGIELNPGEKVLVVEDVTTTGGSARQVVELVRRLGAEPIAVAAVIDRSAGAAKFDVPFLSLIELQLQVHKPEQCPLCQEGLPLYKPGSTKKPPGS
ncbi:MAG: orotate phosphoribosyltransferase [Candidatus Obscuribacterales bacterium]|nr:orotate phosphoribosyltransferase [Candidatus Obscuribacterales bacterium]